VRVHPVLGGCRGGEASAEADLARRAFGRCTQIRTRREERGRLSLSLSFHPRLSLVGETDRFHEGLKILRTPDVARNVAAVWRDERDLDS